MADPRQLALFAPDSLGDAKLEPYAVPPKQPVVVEAYKPWSTTQLIETGDLLALINSDTGQVKGVKFCMLAEGRAHVAWPIANTMMEVSLKTGAVVAPRSLSMWNIEPNALKVLRTMRTIANAERKFTEDE
jgi:hypothetical protein